MYVDNHIWTFKDRQKKLELKSKGVPYFQENSKKMVNSGFFWIAGSYGWNIKNWLCKIGKSPDFFPCIDDYASVAFILSSSIYAGSIQNQSLKIYRSMQRRLTFDDVYGIDSQQWTCKVWLMFK